MGNSLETENISTTLIGRIIILLKYSSSLKFFPTSTTILPFSYIERWRRCIGAEIRIKSHPIVNSWFFNLSHVSDGGLILWSLPAVRLQIHYNCISNINTTKESGVHSQRFTSKRFFSYYHGPSHLNYNHFPGDFYEVLATNKPPAFSCQFWVVSIRILENAKYAFFLLPFCRFLYELLDAAVRSRTEGLALHVRSSIRTSS